MCPLPRRYSPAPNTGVSRFTALGFDERRERRSSARDVLRTNPTDELAVNPVNRGGDHLRGGEPAFGQRDQELPPVFGIDRAIEVTPRYQGVDKMPGGLFRHPKLFDDLAEGRAAPRIAPMT